MLAGRLHQRGAVRARGLHRFQREPAAGAGAVLHHHLRRVGAAQALGVEAGDRVGGAAGREADDPAREAVQHRLLLLLRGGAPRPGGGGGGARERGEGRAAVARFVCIAVLPFGSRRSSFTRPTERRLFRRAVPR